MCQEHYWSISFFIFWKYGLNYTRKSKFWLSYACYCLEIMAQNHKNLDFHQTLRLHISHGYHLHNHLHILFSGFWESHLGVLILCGAKIMCQQGHGTEWSLKIQFLFKNCFAIQPTIAAALGLVQKVNTLLFLQTWYYQVKETKLCDLVL